jgi:uncharacterized membrane protein YdjX (TVP38/TMEM64 family)
MQEDLLASYNPPLTLSPARSTVGRMRQWTIVSILLLVFILVPFVLLEDPIHGWISMVVTPHAPVAVIASAVIVALALDVFLPVPSSVVSTAAGALLGFTLGAAISTAGMSIGCVLAYWFGTRAGLPVVRRMVGDRDLDEISRRFRSSSEWALAGMRPVPVLAEASALLAGVTRVPFGRYLTITTLANTGISVVYSAAGSNARSGGSFLLAFAAAVALPGCLMLARRWSTRHRRL